MVSAAQIDRRVVAGKAKDSARDAASAPAIRSREKSVPLGTSTVIAPGRPPVAAGASVKSRFAIVKIAALTKTDRTEPEKGSVGTPAPIFENC